MGLAHLYLPPEEKDTLVVDYVNRSINNKALQRHLLNVNTLTLASTVFAIEKYSAELQGHRRRKQLSAYGTDSMKSDSSVRSHGHYDGQVGSHGRGFQQRPSGTKAPGGGSTGANL